MVWGRSRGCNDDHCGDDHGVGCVVRHVSSVHPFWVRKNERMRHERAEPIRSIVPFFQPLLRKRDRPSVLHHDHPQSLEGGRRARYKLHLQLGHLHVAAFAAAKNEGGHRDEACVNSLLSYWKHVWHD